MEGFETELLIACSVKGRVIELSCIPFETTKSRNCESLV